MAIGQAAGIAAHLAIAADVPVSRVDVASMQRLLLQHDQVLTYFKDLDPADPSFQAMQFLGTKGLFQDYNVRSSDPLEYTQAVDWLKAVLPDVRLPRQTGRFLHRTAMQALAAGPESDWADPRNINRNPDQRVLRGEFCRSIYQRLSGR